MAFPSPAQDYMSPCIDLNRELALHPAATFYGRVVSDAMSAEGVQKGDVLVIDRAIEPEEGALAVCYVDGEFALRRIAGDDADSIGDLRVWGVVTYIIKKVRGR